MIPFSLSRRAGTKGTSGRKDGFGRLYVDGKDQGAFENWSIVFNWDVSKSALTLGLNYIGWMDDVAVFNRPLSAAEVSSIYGLKDGLQNLSLKATKN